MKKTILTIAIGILSIYIVNAQSIAPRLPFVYQGDTLGYIEPFAGGNKNYLEITQEVGDSVFNEIKAKYPQYNVQYSREVLISKKSSQYYLVRSGRLKNTAIAITTASCALSVATAQPIAAILGGGIGLVLNIMGNNSLIKAGTSSK